MAKLNNQLIQIRRQNGFIESLLNMDVDLIRREGRCAEVLRKLKDEARVLQAKAMRDLLESPATEDPFKGATGARGA